MLHIWHMETSYVYDTYITKVVNIQFPHSLQQLTVCNYILCHNLEILSSSLSVRFFKRISRLTDRKISRLTSVLLPVVCLFSIISIMRNMLQITNLHTHSMQKYTNEMHASVQEVTDT